MNNKVKIAVVGIGLMGSQHLKAINISKKAKIHSIVDINKNSIILIFLIKSDLALLVCIFYFFKKSNKSKSFCLIDVLTFRASSSILP